MVGTDSGVGAKGSHVSGGGSGACATGLMTCILVGEGVIESYMVGTGWGMGYSGTDVGVIRSATEGEGSSRRCRLENRHERLCPKTQWAQAGGALGSGASAIAYKVWWADNRLQLMKKQASMLARVNEQQDLVCL